MKKIIIIILILVAIVIGFVIYNGTTKEYQALRVTASVPSEQVDLLLFVHADTIVSEDVEELLRTDPLETDGLEGKLFEIGGVRRAIYRNNSSEIGELRSIITISDAVVYTTLETGGFDEDELFRFNNVRESDYTDNRAGLGDEGVVTGFEVNINNPSEGVYWMLVVDLQGDRLLSRLENVDFDPNGQRIFESGWENITGDTYYEGTMKLELIQFVSYLDN